MLQTNLFTMDSYIWLILLVLTNIHIIKPFEGPLDKVSMPRMCAIDTQNSTFLYSKIFLPVNFAQASYQNKIRYGLAVFFSVKVSIGS